MKLSIEPRLENISEAVLTIENELKRQKTKTDKRVKAILLLEEVLVRLSETASPNSRIKIVVRKNYRNQWINITSKGEDANIGDLSTKEHDTELIGEEYGDLAENAIRELIIKANQDVLKAKYNKRINQITITVQRNEQASIYDTILALIMGIVAGLAVRNLLAPETVAVINENVFLTCYKLFLKAIELVIAPFIFFGIANSICGFTDLSALGRTGGKVFGMYVCTTIVAIAIAVGVSNVLCPDFSQTAFTLPQSLEAVNAPEITISLKDTLMNIIPNNFVGAFVNANILQILFLSVIVGIAVGRIGKHAERIRTLIEGASDLFSTITFGIAHMLPVAIFGSVASMASTFRIESISIISSWISINLVAAFMQLGVYILLILTLAKLNPINFIRKYIIVFFTAFMTSSSCATVPTSLEQCRKLGVSQKISTFSIPLGANINMDGVAMLFTITTLFMMNLFGIHQDTSTMISIYATIMLISIASPGVPGAATAILVLLFKIAGIPVEAISLVIGLMPLLELVITGVNVVGDGVVTTIVAHSEGELNLETYKS